MTTPAVILMEPKGARNIGGIARLMMNFGYDDLRIVNPRCEINSQEGRQMAMRAKPILLSAKVFSSLDEAQADVNYSIALSDSQVHRQRPHADLWRFCQNLGDYIEPTQDKVAFVFGREESGLGLDEITRCQLTLHIPTHNEFTSLNLTSAAAVVLSAYYDKTKVQEYSVKRRQIKSRPPKANETEFFKALEQLLDRVQFINPQNPQHIIQEIKAIYHRADPNAKELRILFGMLSNVRSRVGVRHQQKM